MHSHVRFCNVFYAMKTLLRSITSLLNHFFRHSFFFRREVTQRAFSVAVDGRFFAPLKVNSFIFKRGLHFPLLCD